MATNQHTYAYALVMQNNGVHADHVVCALEMRDHLQSSPLVLKLTWTLLVGPKISVPICILM